MTALNKQSLRSKARSASAGEWIKESGDGWEAICSTNDQANGNFIIAHFEGPDAKENREFSQAANPATVLALLDELETVQKTSAARLEAIDRTHKMFQRERDRADAAEKRIAEHRKVLNSLAAVARRYLPDYDEHPEIQAADELLESAAGIGVKGE